MPPRLRRGDYGVVRIAEGFFARLYGYYDHDDPHLSAVVYFKAIGRGCGRSFFPSTYSSIRIRDSNAAGSSATPHRSSRLRDGGLGCERGRRRAQRRAAHAASVVVLFEGAKLRRTHGARILAI